MEELELLKKLHDERKTLKELKLSMILAADEFAKNELNIKISETELEITSITTSLRMIDSTDDSYFAWRQMILRLDEYSSAISSVKTSNFITRNQGLVFQNRLFGIIMSDLRSFSEGKKIVPSSSSNLFYTSERTDGIPKDKFADFLNSEAQSLRSLNQINFPDLEEFAMTFMSRAISQFPLN